MAVYRRVYDSCHLQTYCQEPGSASAPDPTLGNRAWATFNSKILLHLSFHKMASVVPLPFIKANYISSISICCQTVLKDPFCDFHSMFQQFDPSVRSTHHAITFAFVDWQYHICFPVLWNASFFHSTIISTILCSQA